MDEEGGMAPARLLLKFPRFSSDGTEALVALDLPVLGDKPPTLKFWCLSHESQYKCMSGLSFSLEPRLSMSVYFFRFCRARHNLLTSSGLEPCSFRMVFNSCSDFSCNSSTDVILSHTPCMEVLLRPTTWSHCVREGVCSSTPFLSFSFVTNCSENIFISLPWKKVSFEITPDYNGIVFTSSVRISCCVSSALVAHFVRSPSSLSADTSIMDWRILNTFRKSWSSCAITIITAVCGWVINKQHYLHITDERFVVTSE